MIFFTSITSFAYLSNQAVLADHGRTLAKCDRIDDPDDRDLCREHARQNPGGTQQNHPSSADCSEEGRTNTSVDALHPENCGITRYIQIFTNALSVLVGVTVIAMLVVGGIRYSSAGANPQAVSSAKKHIANALLALAIYVFMFAFLQWIVPGGLL